jgi:hypothetical protein
VLEPGFAQIGAMLLIIASTLGITFAIQARFSDHRALDVVLRCVLAAVSLVVLMHPSQGVAALACLPVALFVGYWILRRRAVIRA